MVGFSACDDGDYSDWSKPMTSEQEELLNSVDATVQPVTTVIDWANELGEKVKVAEVAGSPNCDIEYTLVFANGATLPIDASGCVETEALKKQVEALFGKAPVEREISADVVAIISVGDVSVKKVLPIVFKAKLTAPEIADMYYIIGAPQGWSNDAALAVSIPFLHSEENVYDDPTFTVTFPAAEEGDTWFAILPGNKVDDFVGGDWSVLLGTTSGNGNNGESGMLAPRTELSDDGSFMVPGGCKFVKVDLNMLDGTYQVAALDFEKYLWVPGNAQGWNPAGAGRIVSENYDGIYTGYIYVDGGFKFTKAADWSHGDFGYAAFGNAAESDFTSSDDGNLVAEAGVYYVTVNLVDMTLASTKIEKVGLIGGFNDWAGDVFLEWNAEKGCWAGDCSAVTDAGWKFRMNEDWAINLGGKSLANLVADGANLTATGSYIELFPLRLEGVSENIYAAMDGDTPVINPGDDTVEYSEYLWTPGNANGWNHAGACRLYSADKDGFYEGFVYVDGEFKFTSQADWNGTNYGFAEEGKLSDDGGAGNLNLGTGVYFVKVDLTSMSYSATAITNMNLVGDFNGWNAADDAQQMTWNTEALCYEISGAGVNANGWKFTANNAWDINLGGSLDKLVGNGDNLSVEGSTIKLYPCRVSADNIYCTVE